MKTPTMVLATALAMFVTAPLAVSQTVGPETKPHKVNLKASQLKEGSNQIASSSDGKLFAIVSGGKVAGFQFKDNAGKDASGTVQKAAAGGPPEKLCLVTICVKTKTGRECWDVYIDCKIVDTIPKDGKL